MCTPALFYTARSLLSVCETVLAWPCRSRPPISCDQCNWEGVCTCVVTTGTMQLLMEPSSLAEGQRKPSLLTLYKSQPLMERQPLVNLQLWTKRSWHELGLVGIVDCESVQLRYGTRTGMWLATYAPGYFCLPGSETGLAPVPTGSSGWHHCAESHR